MRSKETEGWRHSNEYAYPVNTYNKPTTVARITKWAAANGVVSAGRWGKWEHMNSDVIVDEALRSVDLHIKTGEW